MSNTKPEIAKSIKTGDFMTNYHDSGEGLPVLLLHGSGPGVSAWANWRLVIPKLAKSRRVIAPDILGFGYTDRPEGVKYNMDVWVKQVIDFLDAIGIEQTDLVGNSFGGGLALTLTIKYPERFRKVVLMGALGLEFPITKGLNDVWGYEPSVVNMKNMIEMFVYNKAIATDELAKIRYEASIEPGFQEAFSAMFPAPRQQWVKSIASDEASIAAIKQPTLIVHGREDKVIPVESSYKLFKLIDNAQLHIFGQCGHWTQIEHTDKFTKLVDNFLGE